MIVPTFGVQVNPKPFHLLGSFRPRPLVASEDTDPDWAKPVKPDRNLRV